MNKNIKLDCYYYQISIKNYVIRENVKRLLQNEEKKKSFFACHQKEVNVFWLRQVNPTSFSFYTNPLEDLTAIVPFLLDIQ